MDRFIKRLAGLIFVLFLILAFRIADIQIFRAEELKKREANKRQYISSIGAPRGKIFAADGRVLAETKLINGKKVRFYPYKSLFAHTAGYFSSKYGFYGAESAFNEILSPQPASDIFSTGKKPEDVVLSIDYRLQKAAASLLKRKGAVAAVNVKTGEILCMYSYPSFDPNRIDEDFEQLKSSPDAPLINRAAQGVYPPGSTLKILTLASFLEEGGSIEKTYSAPSEFKVGGFRITNFGKKSYGNISVRKAFALSVNTVFAQIGLELGAEKFKNYALRSGLGKKTGFELPENTGNVTQNLVDPVNLAWSAVGQAEMSATPLQILMLTTAIANNGEWVQPTILKDKATVRKRIFTEETGKKVKDAMHDVVKQGTGRQASIAGIEVAGKTGTAEVSGKEPHAWFTGFAPFEDPEIAVVVIVENGGTGGSAAAPIFRELVKTYFYGR